MIKALEAIEGVGNVTVDLEGKSATVELSGTVTDKMLCDAVDEAGYQAIMVE